MTKSADDSLGGAAFSVSSANLGCLRSGDGILWDSDRTAGLDFVVSTYFESEFALAEALRQLACLLALLLGDLDLRCLSSRRSLLLFSLLADDLCPDYL